MRASIGHDSVGRCLYGHIYIYISINVTLYIYAYIYPIQQFFARVLAMTPLAVVCVSLSHTRRLSLSVFVPLSISPECVRPCVSSCICADTLTHTHTCTHTYTHTHSLSLLRGVFRIARDTATYSVLQCVAVCCSVLQCVAVCCSVLQCIAVCCSVLQCVTVCCSVLQCAAVCFRVLQVF